MSLGEQADGRSCRAGGYHQYLKRRKARAERRLAKHVLRQGEQPTDRYGRYRGWET